MIPSDRVGKTINFNSTGIHRVSLKSIDRPTATSVNFTAADDSSENVAQPRIGKSMIAPSIHTKAHPRVSKKSIVFNESTN